MDSPDGGGRRVVYGEVLQINTVRKMADYSKIFVMNDSIEGLAEALEKAALIEHYSGAEVTVLETTWDHVEEESLDKATKANLIAALVAAERKGLRDLMAPYQDRIACLEARVRWSKRPAEVMLEELHSERADFAIKPIGAHCGVRDYLYTPLDWQLLRDAPYPILISRAERWTTRGIVLAAVDAGDAKHSVLSNHVLRSAARIAEVLDATLHCVCVYPNLAQYINAPYSGSACDRVRAELRAARSEALCRLMSSALVNDAKVHLLEGSPARQIQGLATSLKPTVLVVGTSARRGFKKWVIGNTAEDILMHVDCDVMTVRQSD